MRKPSARNFLRSAVLCAMMLTAPGHTDAWVDYSHGIRLVSRKANFNGRDIDLANLLSNPALAVLASDEGPLDVAK